MILFTSEHCLNHAIVPETNQDLAQTVLHWLKWSYRKQAGICIKLQMVFESIWWSTWLLTFQSTGYLQSSKNISISYASQKNCTMIYMLVIFQKTVTNPHKVKTEQSEHEKL
jgi:hypothetical protein